MLWTTPRPALLLALTAALLLGGGSGCGTPPSGPPLPPAAEREASWQGWRVAKDALFQSEDSPLLEEERPGFRGLSYFPYDSTLAFAAALEPVLRADTLRIPTTTGDVRWYVRYGRFSFQLNGRAQQLTVFRPLDPDEPSLFVPFTDPTNRRGTYDGGRYVDLPPPEGGVYLLDLNYAYSPYCAYNPAYSCPIPPAENRLALPVQAGERYPVTVGG